MEFSSPRFAGDALLEDILNDPDTGKLKLKSGSPADSVTKVQQALFDLGWSMRTDAPTSDHVTFVDGDYGPLTSSAVLAYKTHYDIHFPPQEPTGSFDGFAGPRTLKSLDGHCRALDEGAAVLDGMATVVAAASASDVAEAPTVTDDTAIQTYVDDSLAGHGGNAWDAWLELTSMRETDCTDGNLAVAEHYMFARGAVANRAIPPTVMAAWVVAYASFKLGGPGRLLKTGKCDVTPPSAPQVAWGLRGACDGAADLLL
jgi:hypothetical protein